MLKLFALYLDYSKSYLRCQEHLRYSMQINIERRVSMGAPRMRTINEAMELLYQQDPNTAFTKHALRRLIVTDKLPHVMIGRKYLVNFDALVEYLSDKYKT